LRKGRQTNKKNKECEGKTCREKRKKRSEELSCDEVTTFFPNNFFFHSHDTSNEEKKRKNKKEKNPLHIVRKHALVPSRLQRVMKEEFGFTKRKKRISPFFAFFFFCFSEERGFFFFSLSFFSFLVWIEEKKNEKGVKTLFVFLFSQEKK